MEYLCLGELYIVRILTKPQIQIGIIASQGHHAIENSFPFRTSTIC